MNEHQVCIEIGGMAIVVRTGSGDFARLLENRYGSFVVGAGARAEAPNGLHAAVEASAPGRAFRGERLPAGPGDVNAGSDSRASNFQFPVSSFLLDVELVPPGLIGETEDARVRMQGGRWVMERSDFYAEWDPERGRGWVRQSANPFSIDSLLRILHSLILARQGGFLVHAASAIRNGRAFLFSGVSGAGKTTISRLAPPDVALLTDEISYVRSQESGVRSQNPEVRKQKAEGGGRIEDQQCGASDSAISSPALTPGTRHLSPAFVAFGTPFAGELARLGENLSAPIAALYFLSQGPVNRIEAVSAAEAARLLLQNILFFAQDEALVREVFESASDFVSRVPVGRLVFLPERAVWELIK